MNRVGVFAILLSLISFVEGLSQNFPQDSWYPGKVTLETGEEKQGVIKYDLDANLIQLEWENKIETYHASQFSTFSIYMKEEDLYRDFYVLPHANKSGYKRPTIFELIVEGEMSLLAREYIATRNMNANNGFMGSPWGGGINPYAPNMTQRFLAFKLFLVDNQARVRALTTNRKEVIAAFGEHQKEIKRYIKSQKLKTESLVDMAQLVNYFNKLNTKS
jgi:hypothetical protein